MTASSAVLSAGLDQVLSAHLGRLVTVAGLCRLAGGSSHETWGFVATGGEAPVPLVLRQEFERGLLDTDIGAEYALLCGLHDAGIPVPEPWLCATDDSPLGLPFMIMARVEGTDLRKDLAHADHGRDVVALGRQAVELQARIHAVDTARLPGLESEWGPGHEVRRWSAVIDAAQKNLERPDVDPLLATALTWLRVNEPAPVAPCLVHGDFKANNLLVSATGALTLIDWELAHLGDPVEDLAWTMLWRTEWDVVGGLHTVAGYLEAYAHLTGRPVDSDHLRFWRIFSLVKLWAMFITGMTGDRVRPTLRLLGRAAVALADRMAHELTEAVRT